MREIPLTQGKVALVDDADFDRLSQNKYCVRKTKIKGGFIWWAQRAVRVNGKCKFVAMQWDVLLINSFGTELEIDHRDCNGLNNQRNNLRLATHTENVRNRSKTTGTSSRYKGVYWNKQSMKWKAQLGIGGGKIYLGYFESEEDAALAYNQAASRNFGAFARLNQL